MKEMARATDDSKKTFLKEVDFWIVYTYMYIIITDMYMEYISIAHTTCTCMLEIGRRERQPRHICSTCALICWMVTFLFACLKGTTTQESSPSKHPPIHWYPLQGRQSAGAHHRVC